MKKSFLAIALIVIAVAATLVSFCEVKADDVEILSNTIYQTYGYAPFSVSKGDYIVAGEVKNIGSTALRFNITATFYDEAGTFLGASSLSDSPPVEAPTCYLHVLLPGKKAPFIIWFSRFGEDGNFRVVDHYELTVSTSPAGIYKTGFELISNSSHEAGGSLFVEGDLKNVGTAYIDGYRVFVTWYEVNGGVLAVTSEGGGFTAVDPATGEKGLAPNQAFSFMVALNGFNEGGRLEKVSRYEVSAEGYDYSLWGADGKLVSPEVVYILGVAEEETDDTTGSGGVPYTLYIVAAVVVLALLVLALFFFRRRNSHNQAVEQTR